MRLSTVLLPILLAWPAAGVAQAPARCVAAPAETTLPGLRPQPAAVCDYEPAELHARLARLMAVPMGALRIEYLERLFGLPTVTTMADDPFFASYNIVAQAASGRSSWIALIVLNEQFPRGRPRFRGSLRPVHVNPRERGEIDVHITLLGPPSGFVPGRTVCLPLAPFLAQAERAGWRNTTYSQGPTLHGATNPIRLQRGGLIFWTSVAGHGGYPQGPDIEAACLHNVDLRQPPGRRR
jgi:hypothetical protein